MMKEAKTDGLSFAYQGGNQGGPISTTSNAVLGLGVAPPLMVGAHYQSYTITKARHIHIRHVSEPEALSAQVRLY